jgi:uncharacterized membrane protein SirB2
MDAWYSELRIIHIGAVILSGSLFLLRGLALNLFTAAWPMRAPVRYLSYAIDTILLAAAIALTTIVGQYPFINAWLTAKVLLLVVYIVLGSFALKRARTKPARLAFFLAALLVFGFVVSIARAHDPLGVFSAAF